MKFGSDNLVGLEHLIRRLPVIAVEDMGSCPMRRKLMPPLVWLMCATRAKGGKDAYSLTQTDLNFVLGAVHALCRCPNPRTYPNPPQVRNPVVGRVGVGSPMSYTQVGSIGWGGIFWTQPTEHN